MLAQGGAVCVISSSLVLRDTTLLSNRISVHGASASLQNTGGALFAVSCAVSMLRCNLTSNSIFCPTGETTEGLWAVCTRHYYGEFLKWLLGSYNVLSLDRSVRVVW